MNVEKELFNVNFGIILNVCLILFLFVLEIIKWVVFMVNRIWVHELLGGLLFCLFVKCFIKKEKRKENINEKIINVVLLLLIE